MADATLGAIALLDPAIKIGNKVWKKWKLQKNFGKDFVKYSDLFYDEGVILEELLRTPISLLVDGEASSELEFVLERVGNPNELEQLFEGRPAAFTKTRQILRTLAKLYACFNNCAALIDKYAPAETKKTQSDAPTNGSLYRMKSVSDESTSDHNSKLSLFSSRRTPLLKRVSTGVFRRRESKTSSLDSRSSTSSTPSALRHPAIEQEAESGRLRAESAQSSTSTMTRLFDWVNKDVSEFKDLIHEIQAGNAFIERLVQIAGASKSQAPQESSASLVTTNAILEEASGPYLKVLAEILQYSTRAKDATFALELKESYKSYADNVRKEGSHTYLGIEEGGRLFPLSAFTEKSPGGVAGTDGQTGLYSDVVLNMKPAFEANHHDSSIDGGSDTSNGSCWKFDHGALRRTLSSALYYEKQGDITHSSQSIRIFQHFPASNQHLGYLKNLLHDVRLRDSELVAFRYHLAYSISAFYISALQTPFAVRKPDLVFFLEQPPFEEDAESLAVRLAAPYIYGFSSKGSGKAQGKEQSLQGARFAGQVTSLQRLGILLHEIGAWQAIEGVRLSDALDRTWVELPRSQEAMGLRYRDAVRFCLDATSEQDAEAFRKWVLAPLLSLKMGHVLPSIEIYE